MLNLKSTIIILLVFCTQIGYMFGQNNCDKWAFAADFDMLNPVKNLKLNGYNLNYGVNFDLFYLGFERNKIGFHPGVRLRGGATGMNSRSEFIGEPINQDGTRGIYNSAFDGKFVGRIIFNHFYKFRPYLEADMGVRFAGANEQIETFGVDEEDSLDYSEFITKGVSGTYGFGCGILIRLTDRVDLNLRSNFDLTNTIKHVDFNTAFPFEETRTNDSFNQRFAIGFYIHIGCEPEERETKTKNRIRSNTKTKRKKVKRPDTDIDSRNNESPRNKVDN